MTGFLNFIVVIIFLCATVAAFIGGAGLFAGAIKWFALWFGGAIVAFVFAAALADVASDIDPNWCEKQRHGKYGVSLSTNFDEYERRCLD